MPFEGARLREAREARGLSVGVLSREAKISAISIRRLETDAQNPSAETVIALADALRVPVAFFAQPTLSVPPMPAFFRSLTSVRKPIGVKMAERRLAWAHAVVDSLSDFIELPPNALPRFSVPSDPCDITFDDVETLAVETRKTLHLGDGAISNMGWLLENNGCIVVRDALGTDGIDAFSQCAPTGRPLVFLGRHSSSVRHQFDYAHELGHLILHRNLDKQHLKDVTTYRLVEQQAHRFASSFLLPEEPFKRSIGKNPTLHSLLALKRDWLVSVSAMVKRCETTGVLSKDEARVMWIGILKRGWKQREPLDDEMSIEPPQLLREAVTALRNEEPQAFRTWIGRLDPIVPAADVADITGSPSEWFRPSEVNKPRVGLKVAVS